MNQNNICGPYTAEDWLTMKMLKKSINALKDKKPEKFKFIIKHESKKLKEYLNKAA